MIRKISILVGVFLLVAAAAFGQETSTPQAAVPATLRDDMDCTGFIAGQSVPYEAVVFAGADNDLHQSYHRFTLGDSVFLSSNAKTNFAPGTEFSLIRPGHKTFEAPFWYPSQGAFLRGAGIPYEDVGRIKVTRVTAQGAIAEVTFACGAVYPGDLAIAYKTRPIPQYTPTKGFDRFAEPNSKKGGILVAGKDNVGIVGTGSIVYLNLGERDGVAPGQMFRTFHFARGRLETVNSPAILPREATGEVVVLSTQEKSSVGIVVRAIREIMIGDGVELE